MKTKTFFWFFKKLIYSILVSVLLWFANIQMLLAQPSVQGSPVNGSATAAKTSSDTIVGVSSSDLRSGNIDINTIPNIMRTIIELIIGLSGTISVVMLIYCALQMQINSGITGDASGVDKYKKWMFAAIFGFILSVSAWFLMDVLIRALSIASSS